jgi:hypothetical protein
VISENALEQLNTLDGYRQSFMDVSLWWPHIESICSRYFQVPCWVLRYGLPWTYSTFIVYDRWVVKLFERLFDGVLAYYTKKQVNSLLVLDSSIPAPKTIVSGILFEASES